MREGPEVASSFRVNVSENHQPTVPEVTIEELVEVVIDCCNADGGASFHLLREDEWRSQTNRASERHHLCGGHLPGFHHNVIGVQDLRFYFDCETETETDRGRTHRTHPNISSEG
jgi:hypothetical protein